MLNYFLGGQKRGLKTTDTFYPNYRRMSSGIAAIRKANRQFSKPAVINRGQVAYGGAGNNQGGVATAPSGATAMSVYDEGVLLDGGQMLNFTGAGIAAAFNPATNCIDITVNAIINPGTARTFYVDSATASGVDPTHLVDGVRTVFKLDFAPLSNTLSLFRNGQHQVPGIDFTLAGDTITIISPSLGVPSVAEQLDGDYRSA